MQLALNQFLDDRTITELLKKYFTKRKSIDRHMINNDRLRMKLEKRILDSKNVVIDKKKFDPSFIRNYKDTNAAYTHGD